MSRMITLFALAAVLALCAPAAMAVTIGDDGPGPHNIVVTCDIPDWAQVIQEDLTITFVSDNDATGDWYHETLVEGAAYSALPSGTDEVKASTDPWAGYATGVYYESKDSARIVMRSNCGMSFTVGDPGDLAWDGNSIPTWFTLSGFANPNAVLGGTAYNFTSVLAEAGTTGTFFYESVATTTLAPGPTAADVHPTQDAIRLGTSSGGSGWAADLTGGRNDATLTMAARILRNGITDPSGVYTTTIPITFTAS